MSVIEAPAETTTLRQILTDAADLLRDPSKRALDPGARYFEDEDGLSCGGHIESAVRVCGAGAFRLAHYRLTGKDRHPISYGLVDLDSANVTRLAACNKWDEIIARYESHIAEC